MQTGNRRLGRRGSGFGDGSNAVILNDDSENYGFAVLLITGWFIAGLVEKGIAGLLRTARLDDLAVRSGLGEFVGKMGVKINSAYFIGLILLVAAFNALGFQAVSDVFHQLLRRLPALAGAFVVLVFGGLAAGALSSLVRGATSRAELGNPDLLAKISSVTVWAFAIVIAINQISTTRVNALFMATVGAAALALNLAFGLSGREIAAKITRGWYEKGKRAIPRMRETAQEVKEQARQQRRQRIQPPR